MQKCNNSALFSRFPGRRQRSPRFLPASSISVVREKALSIPRHPSAFRSEWRFGEVIAFSSQVPRCHVVAGRFLESFAISSNLTERISSDRELCYIRKPYR